MTNIVDIEVFPNFYFCGIKDYREKKIFSFEISKYLDQREEFYKWYSNYKGYLVTFNGEQYDNVVNNYIIKSWDILKNLSVEEFNLTVKNFSDEVINDNYEKIKNFKKSNGYISIDLFLYWAKSIRQSKKISLKSLAVQLNWDEIQELPYHHTKILSEDEMVEVRRYNLRNDLGITEKLFLEMQGDVGLRYYINQEYKLPCWSLDASKIASELLLRDYCDKTYKPELGISYLNYYNSISKTRFISGDLKIKNVLNEFDPEFKLPVFKKLFEDICNSDRNFSKEIVIDYNDTLIKLSYGIGGLHSINSNECYTSDEEYIIVTSDFASLYPNVIINYLCIRYPEVLDKYTNVKSDRLIAKKAGEKKKDTFLKLILNSLSGLLDLEYSWLYYPEGALRMRIIGQMILTKLAETTILNGWKVISLNTDGQETIIPKKDFERYKEVLSNVEKQFNIALEHDQYEFINYLNVNNYIAKSVSGSIKRKGLFRLDYNEKGAREIPLGDSINELIIAKSLNLYFTKDISIDDSIKNPDKYNFHIYDYCKSNKISKDYTVYHNNNIVQNMNRYYFSKSGPFLFKKKYTKDTFEHVNVGEGVYLFNKYIEKSFEEYNIDYSHYTKKARQIINDLKTNQRQLSLF